MTKQRGGLLAPASDLEEERMARFKTGEIYPVDIKLKRNNKFHGKVFLFFTFCFEEYYHSTNRSEFHDLAKQFDTFRKELTIIAGYHDETYFMNGSVCIEAQSLAFNKMDQEQFEQCYTALINAASKHIFKNISDETYNKLLSFF